MPRDKSIQKVLVVGSGPIVIGQAAEFDYAGAQACRVLRQEGIATVLVNSNPATIMTDKHMADAIYLEPVAEGADNPYINVIVARTEDKDNEDFKKVVAAYQTDEVIKVIEEVSKGSSIPVWTKK